MEGDELLSEGIVGPLLGVLLHAQQAAHGTDSLRHLKKGNFIIFDGNKVNHSIITDAVRKKILVKPDGFPQENHDVQLLCTKDNEKLAKNLNCSPPKNIVEDSARATYVVTGVFGPILDNLDSFIQLPMGCGEQIMAAMVPSLYVLTYLDSIGAAEPQLRDKAFETILLGYQQQLTYKNPDGSYSIFSGLPNPRGSIWLTAFVVKSFSRTKTYISINDTVIDSSKKFILKNQDEDGCFLVVGRVFSSGLRGGVEKGVPKETLTAYIIIALLEAGEDPSSQHMKDALQCIKKMPKYAFAHALAAYAWFLAYQKHTLLSKT